MALDETTCRVSAIDGRQPESAVGMREVSAKFLVTAPSGAAGSRYAGTGFGSQIGRTSRNTSIFLEVRLDQQVLWLAGREASATKSPEDQVVAASQLGQVASDTLHHSRSERKAVQWETATHYAVEAQDQSGFPMRNAH